MASDLAGWPLIVTIAGSAIAVAVFRRERRMRGTSTDAGGEQAAAGAPLPAGWPGSARASRRSCLLYPDVLRYALPLAHLAGPGGGHRVASSVCSSRGFQPSRRSLVGLGFAGSLVCSTAAVAREPLFPTYWKTTGLIDDLVNRFGVSNLVNVGNCAAWNVCKTGLMNELRDEPGNCFVLHDLTKVPRPLAPASSESGRRRGRAGAVGPSGGRDAGRTGLESRLSRGWSKTSATTRIF